MIDIVPSAESMLQKLSCHRRPVQLLLPPPGAPPAPPPARNPARQSAVARVEHARHGHGTITEVLGRGRKNITFDNGEVFRSTIGCLTHGHSMAHKEISRIAEVGVLKSRSVDFFVLLLNADTWCSGEATTRLIGAVKNARELPNVKIVMIHAVDPEIRGVPFDFLFQVTPSVLSGLYMEPALEDR